MTKREFDAETKVNYGAHMGNRTAYRAERGHVRERDYLAERCYAHWKRNWAYSFRDGFLPVLGIGSKYRAPTAFRAARGLPLLTRSDHGDMRHFSALALAVRS